jgi:hypothetical protein
MLANAFTYAKRTRPGTPVAVSEANRGRTGNEQNTLYAGDLIGFSLVTDTRSSVLVAGLQAIVRGQRRARLRALARPEFHTGQQRRGNWRADYCPERRWPNRRAYVGTLTSYAAEHRSTRTSSPSTSTAGQKQPASPSPWRRSNDPRTSGLRTEQFQQCCSLS